MPMDKSNFKFAPATADAQKVDAELKRRLDARRDSGVIDTKAMCSPDRNSTSKNKRWVLNNVLRLREEGKLQKGNIIKA